MNERIQELAEQAGSTHKQNLGVYQFYTDELEKFAELIVKECMLYLGGGGNIEFAKFVTKLNFGVE
jgi:hypothetical protein